MSTDPVAHAHHLMTEAITALNTAAGAGAATEQMLSVLTIAEGVTRQLDVTTVHTIGALQRQGAFVERGYRSTVNALKDLLGWETFEARQRVTAADHVCPRTALDGSVLPPKLEATAAAFTDGRVGVRHVEVMAKVLGSAAAARLPVSQWELAEVQLAGEAQVMSPSALHDFGASYIDLLDQDGAEPDDRPPLQINELKVVRCRGGSGGTITGRFDSAPLFDAIARVIDAKSRPLTGEDPRGPLERQAEALADVCGWVFDHGDVPECGGERPHLNVLIRLEDLEGRGKNAVLDFGGVMTAPQLRMLACDVGVIPIVMGGNSQPLDIGTKTRSIPDGIRRAVAARDRGCARCGRPPSWCEVHHVIPWEHGGPTAIDNCVMLCRAHHREIHSTGWTCHIRDGRPEFIPPDWLDPPSTYRLIG